jgi:hypothetical protein
MFSTLPGVNLLIKTKIKELSRMAPKKYIKLQCPKIPRKNVKREATISNN